MTISDSLASKSLSKAKLFFVLLLPLQLLLAVMVTIGLFHLGFWKTAVLEICKLGFVLPQAFRFRRASLEQDAPLNSASLLAGAALALLSVSAFADAILISYDIQAGIAGH